MLFTDVIVEYVNALHKNGEVSGVGYVNVMTLVAQVDICFC